VLDFIIVEDISSVIDPRLSQVVLEKPFVELSNMTYDLSLGIEHTQLVYFRNEEDMRRGVDYVMNKILGFYKECLKLGHEYLTGLEGSGSGSSANKEGFTGRKVEVWFGSFGGGGEEVGNCGGNGGRGSSIFGRGGGSLAICSMESKDGLGGGGLVVVGGRSSSMSKRAWGEVGGVENNSLMGSMLMSKGEECLDGWVRAGGGEVKGGGVDFGVTKSLLGEIPEENTGESDGEEFGVDEGAVW
ncbi:hypothetical protein Tco_1356071, partial [Tanacetum coccineum]